MSPTEPAPEAVVHEPTLVAKVRPELVAVAAVALAIALRAALNPALGGTQVWLTFWPAVFLAAWYGGIRAGVEAVAMSIVVVAAWLVSHPYLTTERALIGGIVFVVCGIAFACVAEQTRRGRREERRLRQVAEQARRDERRHRESIVALIELSTLLAAAESIDHVGETVITEGMRGSGADTATLYVVDDASRCLQLVCERGCAPDVIESIREIPLDSEHGRTLAGERWVEAAEDYAATLPQVASIPSAHRRAEAWWSMPLVAAGRTVGVLAMGFYAPRRFTAEDREQGRLFAQHCAQALARAERAARLERERLRLARIFDANLIGTVFWDRRGAIIRANDSFLRSIGYTREDLETGRIDWRVLTPPEYAAADAAAVARVTACGFHEPYEKAYLHRDGRRVPMLVSSAAFFDDPHQGVTFIADLTEVKRAAGAANRAKDEFLAMLGHELRNPLAPITTALELIELRGVASAERALGIINRQVRHLTRMVDDLLDISRITAGKIQLARRKSELHEVIARAVEMASPLLEERGHRLAIDVPPELIVDVDATRMSQVFANILTNAGKYTDARGEIRITGRADGDEIIADIIDTGVGIDPTLLPGIFELFTQEPQSMARSRGGLGLGLAIARTLVALHGGTLTAHSDGRGLGSRFSVRLPRGSMPEPVRERAPIRDSAGGKRVLVVDDNRDAAEMLATLAEHCGHAARRAGDGPDALRILEDFTPDVALLDLGLPVMDGYELAHRIRQIPHLATIRLVAITGYGQASDRAKAHAAGFDVHLVKPVLLEDVVRAIDGDPGG